MGKSAFIRQVNHSSCLFLFTLLPPTESSRSLGVPTRFTPACFLEPSHKFHPKKGGFWILNFSYLVFGNQGRIIQTQNQCLKNTVLELDFHNEILFSYLAMKHQHDVKASAQFLSAPQLSSWFLREPFCKQVAHTQQHMTGQKKRVSVGSCHLEISATLHLSCNSHGNWSSCGARRSWRHTPLHASVSQHNTSSGLQCYIPELHTPGFVFLQWAVCRPVLRLWNGGPVAGRAVRELQSTVHRGSAAVPLQCE